MVIKEKEQKVNQNVYQLKQYSLTPPNEHSDKVKFKMRHLHSYM